MRRPPLPSRIPGVAPILAIGALGACASPGAAPAPASSPTPHVAPEATVVVPAAASSTAADPPPSASATAASSADAGASARVPVITHPRPPKQASDVGEFVRAGCTRTDARLACDRVAAIHAMGCDRDVLWIDDDLAALSALHPIATCLARTMPGTSVAIAPQGIVEVGCMIPATRRYVVAMNGKLELVTSAQRLAAIYQPIRSGAVAMALATAVSKARPLFAIDLPARMTVYLPRVETSFAEPRADGSFDVLLYERDLCGCGPHLEHEVRFRVLASGEVQSTSNRPAWEDPFDHVCVD